MYSEACRRLMDGQAELEASVSEGSDWQTGSVHLLNNPYRKPPVQGGPPTQAVRRIKPNYADLTTDAPGRAHKIALGRMA